MKKIKYKKREWEAQNFVIQNRYHFDKIQEFLLKFNVILYVFL